ncbi:MAG: GNAT family N-acetyltransferase [bacterium]|nr:GNAT family N-acetyltransferase [bacterium]
MSSATCQPTQTPPREPRTTDVYACLRGREPSASGYRICTLRERDIESIRRWRNAQIDVLRQTAPISQDEQQRYFDSAVRPTFEARHPTMILFSLILETRCIGYCGLTNLDWQAGRAEISFLLDPERVADLPGYRRDFSVSLELLSHTAFEILGLHRLFAETFEIRPNHIEILEDHGFVLEGRLRQHAFARGGRVDSLVHGLLAADHARRQPSSADIRTR